MKIIEGGLDDLQVQALLARHVHSAREQTAPGSAHALDLSGLRLPDVSFWSAWEDGQLAGVAALKRLSGNNGEIKSMHTAQSYRRRGVASLLLRHIIDAAPAMRLARLNLETGSRPHFEPARELYRRHGFAECAPFGDYAADANSVFMRLDLRAARNDG